MTIIFAYESIYKLRYVNYSENIKDNTLPAVYKPFHIVMQNVNRKGASNISEKFRLNKRTVIQP